MADSAKAPGIQTRLDFETAARQRSYRKPLSVAERDVLPGVHEPHGHSPARKTSVFHPEGSSIGRDRFAIKLSYSGQAYLIQGSYHTVVEKSFSDGSAYAVVVDRVTVDRIYLYRNAAYVFVPISKNVSDRLSHLAAEILKNPEHNRSLSERT